MKITTKSLVNKLYRSVNANLNNAYDHIKQGTTFESIDTVQFSNHTVLVSGGKAKFTSIERYLRMEKQRQRNEEKSASTQNIPF